MIGNGLVNPWWLTKLQIRERLTQKIKVGFGPIATGEDTLAERKWRIDPIVNEINSRKTPYFASVFLNPEEIEQFDVVIFVKRFHAESFPLIRRLKESGTRFLYDIVDNPNAGKRHGIFFGDCPEFSSLMEGFILSSPLHEPIVQRFSQIYDLIEHPILNRTFKTDYSIHGTVKILVHGYYENLIGFKALEPIVRELSNEIGKSIQLIFHSEKVFSDTEHVKHVRWTKYNSFNLMPEMDFALTAKDLNNPHQRSKPSTKVIAFLAAGLPVICTPTPADLEVLTEGETALFAYRPEDWARHIKTLCLDQSRRLALGKKGRELVWKRYTVSKITDKYLRLLDRLAPTLKLL